MRRLGILLSGRGSNFEAIARNIADGKLDAEIAVVISNRPGAPGLEIAHPDFLAGDVPFQHHQRIVSAEKQNAPRAPAQDEPGERMRAAIRSDSFQRKRGPDIGTGVDQEWLKCC